MTIRLSALPVINGDGNDLIAGEDKHQNKYYKRHSDESSFFTGSFSLNFCVYPKNVGFICLQTGANFKAAPDSCRQAFTFGEIPVILSLAIPFTQRRNTT